MTQPQANHLDREHSGKVASEFPAANPVSRTEELSALLDRVRHHVALFVSEIPRLPRALRVRAGEVSVDIRGKGAGHGSDVDM